MRKEKKDKLESLLLTCITELPCIMAIAFGYWCISKSSDMNFLSGLVAGAFSLIYGVGNSKLLANILKKMLVPIVLFIKLIYDKEEGGLVRMKKERIIRNALFSIMISGLIVLLWASVMWLFQKVTKSNNSLTWLGIVMFLSIGVVIFVSRWTQEDW